MLPPNLQPIFEQSNLFSGCPPEEIVCAERSFGKGEKLPTALEGEPAIGVVIQGRVQVYSICADGTKVNLSTLEPGDSFGISNIFTGEDLATVLVSTSKTRVAYVPKHCFLTLLDSVPGMMLRYATLCNRKLRYLTEKIQFLTIPSCRARLAGWLLRNSIDGTISLAVSKEHLARIMGVSRASLFRELRYLGDAGYISIHKKTISIHDEGALRRILDNG